MGSDESHFNVSVGSDGQSHKTVSTNHNLFEEKGEPKRYRTEVLPLTSLTPYRYAKPAHLRVGPTPPVSSVDGGHYGSRVGLAGDVKCRWSTSLSALSSLTGVRVPGEIKRSRDLRGRWSWTLKLAQKRS